MLAPDQVSPQLPVLCPSTSPNNVLTISPGRWAIEVAEEYPQTQVIGLDLTPIRPSYAPSNCTFRVGDLVKDLKELEEGTFDFVHSRMLAGGVKAENWDGYVQDMYRLLKPGGWCQMGETSLITWDDNGPPPDSPFAKVHNSLFPVQ